MPIVYRIDPRARLVFVVAHGVMSDSDTFGYQREVWSRADVAGYDELIDVSRVTEFALPSAARVRDLADLSVGMDQQSKPSRLAIIAPSDGAYGLGRMYQAYRELDPRGAKAVGVFRSEKEALDFLGLDAIPPIPLADGPDRER